MTERRTSGTPVAHLIRRDHSAHVRSERTLCCNEPVDGLAMPGGDVLTTIPQASTCDAGEGHIDAR